MKIILYSTHCPRCNVLEKKLKTKNISYEEINDLKKELKELKNKLKTKKEE